MITQIDENGKMITDNDEILECCAKYYERNSRSTGTDRTVMEQFLPCQVIPKLSSDEKEKCEGPISDEECKAVLSRMNKNKAPGVSGFKPDFFLYFCGEISGTVVKYTTEPFNMDFSSISVEE